MRLPALKKSDFDAFFQAIHSVPPFDWQRRAAEELVDGLPWPTLEAPTGAGKTSLIDCLVFALACQAGTEDRTVPLRTFWVVDRRAVVDQVYDHARSVRAAIAHGNGVLEAVRARLESFDRLGGLVAQRWRGGVEGGAEQLRISGPAVICSTIDQVGSRLLFRGYGTSRRSRPLDAALTGNDSLIVVDEAHIAQPFLQTLAAVRTLAAPLDASSPTKPALRTVLSATLPAHADPGFRLNDEERHEERIAPRLSAQKQLRLVRHNSRQVGLVGEAQRLAESTSGLGDARPVIGVMANTVRDARTVYRALKDAGACALLVIGPCRPYDRDGLLAEVPDRASREDLDAPHFVVATQTIEVGVDLDFDALVTAAAPLPALIQRLGRLDRVGALFTERGAATEAAVVTSPEPCPVYGDLAAETWRWLDQRAQRRLLTVDAATLTAWKEEGPPDPTPPLAPILGPWHVETLCQTSIDPVPSPEVGPFLHGERALEAADVSLAWRADIDPSDIDAWPAQALLAPPRPHELLSLPVRRARSWLQRMPGDTDLLAFGDVESLADQPSARPGPGRQVVRWDRKQPVVIQPDEISPGDTLLVPACYGGADRFGWQPEPPVEDVPDVRDLKSDADRLRVHRRLVPDELVAAVAGPLGGMSAGELDAGEAYIEALAALRASSAELDAELKKAIETLPDFGELVRYPNGGEAAVLVGKTRGSPKSKPVSVSYKKHVNGVDERVRLTTAALGLQDTLRDALLCAARLHDVGKLDPRFQAYLNGGTQPPTGELLAKSGRTQGTQQDILARRQADWPEGMRHELWSAALAESLGERKGWAERELIVHLIAVHHGQHRPFYGEDRDAAPIEYEAEDIRLSSNARLPWPEHARRFMELNRRFGPWGLATLEAILVLSDRAVSAEEQA